jgi:hypothetical protein
MGRNFGGVGSGEYLIQEFRQGSALLHDGVDIYYKNWFMTPNHGFKSPAKTFSGRAGITAFSRLQLALAI